jgi:hypothetical protein
MHKIDLRCFFKSMVSNYPLVVKHSNGNSPVNGNMICWWEMFHCYCVDGWEILHQLIDGSYTLIISLYMSIYLQRFMVATSYLNWCRMACLSAVSMKMIYWIYWLRWFNIAMEIYGEWPIHREKNDNFPWLTTIGDDCRKDLPEAEIPGDAPGSMFRIY